MRKVIVGCLLVVMGVTALSCDVKSREHGDKVDLLLMESDNVYNLYGDEKLSKQKFKEALDLTIHIAEEHKEDFSPEGYHKFCEFVREMREHYEDMK